MAFLYSGIYFMHAFWYMVGSVGSIFFCLQTFKGTKLEAFVSEKFIQKDLDGNYGIFLFNEQ